VIYNEKSGKTKNRGNEKCRNKCKDGEQKILENEKCDIEKSRVRCI
jgi:hypothetical protein